MANVSFIGFVNDWQKDNPQHPSWALKVGEPHRKKLPNGDYETVGTTYWTVKAGWDSTKGAPASIDFTEFSVGDRVEIKGVSVTEKWEANGKKGSTLICKAESVSHVMPSAIAAPKQAGTVQHGYEKAVFEPAETELPF